MRRRKPWHLAIPFAMLAAGAPAPGQTTQSDAATADDPRVAEVLTEIAALDRAVVEDDGAAFTARLAEDLVVNNPQNGLSPPGATAQAQAAGRISYSRYERAIDYTGMRGEMVLVLGGETVVPRPPHPAAGQTLQRRFMELWKRERGRWVLTARQASVF
jgi:hypothetical protein